MSYKLSPENMYRMPTHFGRRTGPRRGPDNQGFECKDSPQSTVISVAFLGNPNQLEDFMPPGFTLSGEPVVSVTAIYMTDIDWLAGRGYNILGVRVPATFTGEKDTVTGTFLAVLWENLTDPIITGREELGYSKIYAELPEPKMSNSGYSIEASWLGYRFLDLDVTGLEKSSDEDVQKYEQSRLDAGDLHFKYMPRTGEWGTADVSYVTYSPAQPSNNRIITRSTGDGHLKFHAARWEDMPTQYNIVNALSELEICEYRGGSVTETVGGKDLRDTRILR